MAIVNPSKYNENEYLKARISDGMHVDANQFLWRVYLLLRSSDFTDRNWFSKIYVDLMMAIESNLKSIAISLSPKSETPEQAYKKVRSKGHRIKELYQLVETLAKKRLKLLSPKVKNELLNRYSKLGVSNRYELITLYGIWEDIENKNFGENSVKSILQESSLFRLEEIADKLHQISAKARKKNPTIPITGRDALKQQKRVKKFRDSVRL